jgi:hypothetical protein
MSGVAGGCGDGVGCEGLLLGRHSAPSGDYRQDFGTISATALHSTNSLLLSHQFY